MPRLEEVTYYIQGLWLLIKGKPEAFQYLDFSERGFWRSWWALVYCLPPTLLSYAALKVYLAVDPIQSADLGNAFYLKAAVVDFGSLAISILVFFGVARAGGFSQFAAPIIIGLNWLSVPMQWAFSLGDLAQVLSGGSTDLMATMILLRVLLGTFLAYQVINRILGGRALTTIATLLTLNVVPILAQAKIGPLISFSI